MTTIQQALKWEKDPPTEIPKVPCYLPRRQVQYPFDLMEVGESVTVNRPMPLVRQAIINFCRRSPLQAATFVCRSVDKNTTRVWKTSDLPPKKKRRGRPRKKKEE